MFYISRVYLKNIKCFAGETEFTLQAPTEDTPSWTLLFGENGTGKTTLLRCIAMGLCDKTGASGLLTELSGDMIRDRCDDAEIHIDLITPQDPPKLHTIKTIISRNYLGREELDQEAPKKDESIHSDIFACGYGANFGTIGSEVQEKYDPIEAVYTLFNYNARLQNPENALFRIDKAVEENHSMLPDLLSDIDRILLLPDGSTTLDSAGLRVNGPWGTYIPANALGDGYAATLAWICDLLGWYLLATRLRPDEPLRGIVLLDEMERHLHPAWQRRILTRLTDVFPKIQFIATTHAPMTPIGALDLPSDSCQLIVLKHADDGVTMHTNTFLPPHSRADQVLTSELFDLPVTTSDRVVRDIEEYARLKALGSRASVVDRETMLSLEGQIEEALSTPETPLQRSVERAVQCTLDILTDTETVDTAALSFEARRQVKNIFRDSQ